MEHGIELDAVTKHFGAVRAVDNISCAIGKGEFVTILGPSGSGKTTLLSLISGISMPTSGQICLNGRDVTGVTSAQRNIGLVFQSYALFPNMNVFDNVAFPLQVRSVPQPEVRKRVEDALELVRLAGYGKRRIHQLSGGQQQRVALARAIVFEPSILLLDEPLAALDRKLRDEVRLELRRIQRELGVTTLLVTHDQDEALSLSDRLIVVNDGKLQQEGKPADVYLRPDNRFVAGFLGTANFVEGTVLHDGGATTIRLTGGEIMPVAAGSIETGSRICIVVRPERISLDAASAAVARGRGLAATVVDTVYLGTSVRYHLRLEDQKEFVATANDQVARFAAGDAVSIAWEASGAWVLPDAQ